MLESLKCLGGVQLIKCYLGAKRRIMISQGVYAYKMQ